MCIYYTKTNSIICKFYDNILLAIIKYTGDRMILNDEQKAAVEYVDGSQIIIAGPGSGKTRALISKIEYLVNQQKINPRRILTITFSNKASEEMIDRLAESFIYNFHDFHVSTFHSYCWELVREFSDALNFKPDVKILNDSEAWILVRRNIEKLNLNHYMPFTDPFKYIHDLIKHTSRAKDEYVTVEDYHQFAMEKRRQFDIEAADMTEDQYSAELINIEKIEEAGRFYEYYQQLLAESNSIDYGDQILMAVKLLENNPHLRYQIQQRWDYILVDEFQDTNIIQIELIKQIVGDHARVCVVGDPDQNIYVFRGASYASFTKFIDAFPSCKSFSLTQNYRSTANILSTAKKLISVNPDRLQGEKSIWTDNPNGAKVKILHASSVEAESESIANEIYRVILELPESDRRFSDFAILYRGHGFSDQIIAALKRHSIPFKMAKSSGFYEQEEIRDIYAVLHCLVYQDDGIYLHRYLALEDWEIPQSVLTKLYSWIYNNGIETSEIQQNLVNCDVLDQESIEKISEAFNYLEALRLLISGNSASEICREIYESTSILKRFIYDDTLDSRQRSANLGKFLQLIIDFEEKSDDKSLPAFVEYMDYLLESGADEEQMEIDDTRDAVQLMTVHTAKGLEWLYVFVTGLYSRRFPSTKRADAIPLHAELMKDSISDDDLHIPEERRLAYVAFTRAEKMLFLTSISKQGTKQSVFIKDVYPYEGVIEEEIVPEITFNPIINPVVSDDDIIERNIRRRIIGLIDKTCPITDMAPYIELLGMLRNKDKVMENAPEIYKILDNGVDADIVEAVAEMLRRKTVIGMTDANLPQKSFNMSYSKLDLYESCPLAYKFCYDMHIPGKPKSYFSFGNTIHAVLDAFYKEVSNGKTPDMDFIHKAYSDYWQKEGYSTSAQEAGYRSTGMASLEAFYDMHVKNPVMPLYTEWKFTLPVGNHTISGRIDRIDQTGADSCAIWDYKTGKVQSQKEVDNNFQLALYAYAVRECLNLKVDSVGLYFIIANQMITATKTDDEIQEALKKIDEAANSICARNFYPKPDPRKCARCEYEGICDSASK